MGEKRYYDAKYDADWELVALQGCLTDVKIESLSVM